MKEDIYENKWDKLLKMQDNIIIPMNQRHILY